VEEVGKVEENWEKERNLKVDKEDF